MLNYPIKRIIISGKLPEKNRYGLNFLETANDEAIRKRLVNKIKIIIENLLINFNVEIITGNADGAEHIAFQYALDNKIEFVNEYTKWTILGKDRKIDRYKEMANLADMIYLIDYNDSYLYNNFLSVASELEVPVQIIKSEVDDNTGYS